MADGPLQDVLGRKAQAAQRAFEARGMSPTKALRRALSRTADVLWDLALVTKAVSVEMHDQDGVVDGLDDHNLLILLDGPDGALGIASIDREVMTGVIEVQTIMQVTQMPVETDRTLTPTDAAMMSPLLDGTLEKLVANLEGHPLRSEIEGFRFGAMIEDSRAISLLLESPSYRTFRAEIDLALGRRKGVLSITLPEHVKVERDPEPGSEAEPPSPHEEMLNAIPVKLDAVLSRFTLPLSAAEQLKPGDLLPLPVDVLDQLELVDGRRQVVAKGRLGQMHNLRAVRLSWPAAKSNPMDPALGLSDGNAMDGFATAKPAAPAVPAVLEPTVANNPEQQIIDVSDLPDIGMSLDEQLGDLPSLDFEMDAAAFDLDLADEKAEAGMGGESLDDLGDFSFSSEPFEFEDT